MSSTTSKIEARTAAKQEASDAVTGRDLPWEFGAWCLHREAFTKWNYLVLLTPLAVAAFMGRSAFGTPWYSEQGQELFRSLLGICAFFIFVGGVRHASKAVCWEVSRELRDLVRLTGIEPRVLLWCQSLCRWWTIGLSILLILPLFLYARTLGGGTIDQWFVGACWLGLWTLLISGFAMVATVSSGRTSNAETTSAMATFLLLLFYHLIFWGFGAIVWFVTWFVHENIGLSRGSFGERLAFGAYGFAPVTGLYRAIASSTTFSVLDPSYWIHFVTAFLSLSMATTVMRNRFRVTTQGDQDIPETAATSVKQLERSFWRPRCTDHPFFWKDVHILGGGVPAQNRWTTLSCLAFVGIILSVAFGIPAVVGIIVICIAPCLIALRFDALLAAEFRDETWASLMLLPINPHVPILAKVQAAMWERRSILLPVSLAAFMAAYADWVLVLMFIALALIAGVLMIEISILNQFNAKLWWSGPVFGGAIVTTIVLNSIVWASFNRAISFTFAIVTLVIGAFLFFKYIDWRLKNWSED